MTNKGFVIHGHNDSAKLEVARFIEKHVKKEAIILHEQPNKGKTVIEKFESNSDVDFAVALWTADDQGKAIKEEKLLNRARQNVIFETGYFIGKLGRERVIILFEDGVEKPSDYNGVVYIPLSGNWKHELQTEIESIYN
ncbi:MAG: nucleotide-binding protein [Roseivirga sp.]|nr:nucleotide-binding protein [Roseivirga sp.]